MSTSVTWPGGGTGATATAYTVPAAGELNWSALSDFLVALGQGAQGTTFQKVAVRKATITPVTIAVTDCVVGSKLAAPGAVTMNLPAGANKQLLMLFDDTGDAGTNNVTINPNGADTIAGSASLVLSHNREHAILCYNSSDTDWKIVSRGAPVGSIKMADLPALTASKAVVSDASGFLTTATTTTTQVNYLQSAGGTTGTASTNIVFSTSPTLVTPVLGTPSSGTLTSCTGLPIDGGTVNTLPVNRGGTAVTSVTTTPTASAFAGWDVNKNLFASILAPQYTTTATGAGTTTLTNASTQYQFMTGSTTQTIVLPVTSTLATGLTFVVINNSSGVVTVQSSGTNTIQAQAASTVCQYVCILTSGTSAASWQAIYTSLPTAITGTGSQVLATSPSFTTPILGTPTSGNLSNCTAVSLTAGVSGTLPVGNGGTGVTSSTGSTNVVLSASPTLTGTITLTGGIVDGSSSTSGMKVETARASPLAADSQNVYSGTYTPTYTRTSDTFTTQVHFWYRVGGMVTVWGYTVSGGGGGTNTTTITLPFAPTGFSATTSIARSQCTGHAKSDSTVVDIQGTESSTTTATIASIANGSTGLRVFFSYRL